MELQSGRKPAPLEITFLQNISDAQGKKLTLLKRFPTIRKSKKLVVFIVYVALVLDFMLQSVVVPIMPDYLLRMDYKNMTYLIDGFSNQNLTKSNANKSSAKKNISAMQNRTFMEYTLNATELLQLAIANETVKQNKRLLASLVAYENGRIGLFFGSKALAQVFANQLVGPLTNRIGYSIPVFLGCLIELISTLVYAFGTSYPLMVCARVIQGIGSPFACTAGLGMIANVYPDEKKRTTAIGIAIGGKGMGAVLGPLVGGVCYNYAGKALPFLILAALALILGMLQLATLRLKIESAKTESPSMLKLLKDPYVFLTAVGIFVGNSSLALIAATLPLWMISTMGSSPATTGGLFISATVAFLFGSNVSGPLTHKIGCWLCALMSLIMIAAACITVPFPVVAVKLIPSLVCLGFGTGLLDVSLFSEISTLVDKRHPGAYGNVFAIADTSVGLALCLGPWTGGAVMEKIGFPIVMYALGALMLLYAPLMMFLRSPPIRTQKNERKRP